VPAYKAQNVYASDVNKYWDPRPGARPGTQDVKVNGKKTKLTIVNHEIYTHLQVYNYQVQMHMYDQHMNVGQCKSTADNLCQM